MIHLNKKLLIFESGSFFFKNESFGSFHCVYVMVHQNRNYVPVFVCRCIQLKLRYLDSPPHGEERARSQPCEEGCKWEKAKCCGMDIVCLVLLFSYSLLLIHSEVIMLEVT